MNKYWKIIKEKSADLRLEVRDPEGWWSAVCKWDGCVDYTRYHNTPMDVDDDGIYDYLHICDIDEEIARLQALKRFASNYFAGNANAEEYWKPEVIDATPQTKESEE